MYQSSLAAGKILGFQVVRCLLCFTPLQYSKSCCYILAVTSKHAQLPCPLGKWGTVKASQSNSRGEMPFRQRIWAKQIPKTKKDGEGNEYQFSLLEHSAPNEHSAHQIVITFLCTSFMLAPLLARKTPSDSSEAKAKILLQIIAAEVVKKCKVDFLIYTSQ